jgi:DNA-binding XRE family transcriptional regulator
MLARARERARLLPDEAARRLHIAEQRFAALERGDIRPALGKLKVAAVTRNDISKLHRALSRTPRQANFALAICSKAFSLAELWGMRPDGTNPCKRIEPKAETPGSGSFRAKN